MALIHPEAQTLARQFHYPRVAEIERIPAPGPVVIIAIFPYPIIATVVDSAQGDGGTFKIDFRAMVEHDIQNHLDTGGVQRLNRIAKLIQGARRVAGIARIQREPGQRVVAPVVAQPHPLQSRLAGELRHRQQFKGADAQRFEVSDHHRVAQRLIRSADGFRQLRIKQGEPFHVRFIKHRFPPRGTRRFIAQPVVTQIHYLRFWRYRGAIAMIRLPHSAVQALVVRQIALNPVSAGIEQQLGRVKAVSLRRIPGAMHPVAVAQARPDGSQPAVPDVAAARREIEALLVALLVEHAQLHPLRVGGEEGEVHPLAVIAGAQRRRLACREVGHCASRTSQIVASGGRVRDSECSRPWLGMASLSTTPPLPWLLP